LKFDSIDALIRQMDDDSAAPRWPPRRAFPKLGHIGSQA
jgi:hypothetical protein